MSEGDNSEPLLDVTRVHASSGGSETTCYRALVGTERLHALSKDHEGLIDATRLTQAIAGGLGVFCTFGTSQVNEGEAGCLDRARVLEQQYEICLYQTMSFIVKSNFNTDVPFPAVHAQDLNGN